MANYPGKKRVEKAMTPFSRAMAEGLVRSQLLAGAGWWVLRQHGTRKELVEMGVASRRTSYRHEATTEQLFGKPVDDLTLEDIGRWIGAQK